MHAIMSHPARVAAPTARARGRDAKTNARAAIRPTARPREISRVRTARESRLAAVRQPDASEFIDPSQFTELELSTSQMTSYASKRPRGQFASRFGDDEPRKGSDILVEALEREGVDCVFAYPGLSLIHI